MRPDDRNGERIGTRQHYVPQFLLRNFTDDGGSLRVFDKQTDRVFCTSPANMAAECGFYDYRSSEGRTETLDGAMSWLDDQAAEVVAHLLEERGLDSLADHQRYLVAAFAAAQLVRTASLRRSITHVTEEFADRLGRWGTAVQSAVEAGDFEPPFSESAGEGVSLEQLEQLSENDMRVMSLRLIQNSVTRYVPILLQKRWCLAAAPNGAPFYCSDNPVVLHNERQTRFGGLGIGQRGIQIYLPLSSTLMLCMFCPELAQEFRDVENSLPISLPPQCVTFQNSLQVTYAERFVFCKRDGFELIRQILADHPDYRNGPRGAFT